MELLLYALVFPGLLFLVASALFLQYVDRKLLARMQNRVGPPVVQPLADLLKVLAKEDVIPGGVDARALGLIPLLAFAAVATAFLYMPVVGPSPLAFQGDLVVALYLLTLPSILLFLVGWMSRNVFATIGGVRAVTQLFIYEVPLFLALLGPALAAGSWSISDVAAWQANHPWSALLQPIGFTVALVGLQAKLERAPFDIPEADTEIVAGPWTELTGRKLAVMRLSMDMALVAGVVLVADLFLGGPATPFAVPGAWAPALGFAVLAAKALGILGLLAVVRAAVGRVRLDQLSRFGWRYLTPASLGQVALVLLMQGWTP